MSPVPFVSNPLMYKVHYGGSMDRFKGTRYQAGYGLGNFFGSLVRSVVPILKTSAIKAGKSFLRSGVDALGDVIEGKEDIKSVLKRRGLEGLKRAGHDVKDVLVKSVNKKQRGGRQRSTRLRRVRDNDIFDKGVTKKRKKSKYCHY